MELPMISNNVVIFPKAHRNFDRPPQTLEQLREAIQANHLEMIDEITDECIAAVLNTCYSCGISLTNQYDIGMMLESVRSSLMREAGMYNQMQGIADQLVAVTNEKGQRVFANGQIVTSDNNS